MNIAIDGPAGAGKSTIAKELARELNFIYVDTGAMYRAMGLYCLRQGFSAIDKDKIIAACPDMEVSIAYEEGVQQVYLNGENVSGLIRTEEVSRMTSPVSAIPEVRAKLLDLQRDMAKKYDVVMDGRDIGSNVLPDAELKIYLTASVDVRADRRYKEQKERGIDVDIDAIKDDIRARDEQDMTREIAPLKVAQDAIMVDSSYMTIEQVKSVIKNFAKERGLK